MWKRSQAFRLKGGGAGESLVLYVVDKSEGSAEKWLTAQIGLLVGFPGSKTPKVPRLIGLTVLWTDNWTFLEHSKPAQLGNKEYCLK